MGCSREDQSRLCAHRAAALVVGLGVVDGCRLRAGAVVTWGSRAALADAVSHISAALQQRGVVWVGRRSLKAHSVPMLGAVTTPRTHSYSGFSGGTFLLD